MKDNSILAALWENVANGNASLISHGATRQPPNWQYGQVSIMRRQPNIPSIELSVVSTSPNGNMWNTTHNPFVVGSFGVSGIGCSHV